MLVYADEHEQLDIDLQGTLDAAHEAINSFFLLCTLFEDEAMVRTYRRKSFLFGSKLGLHAIF